MKVFLFIIFILTNCIYPSVEGASSTIFMEKKLIVNGIVLLSSEDDLDKKNYAHIEGVEIIGLNIPGNLEDFEGELSQIFEELLAEANEG